MKIWTCGSSPRIGSQNAWTRIKTVNGAIYLSNFWNFFGAIQRISCHDWWPWIKPGYITMNRRQSNNQWSGGTAAHPAQKIPSAKIPWKSSCLDFLESRWHPPHWLSFKGPNYQSGVLLISAGAIKGHFEEKRHLQPRRNWPTWASNVLFTHPIFWIWPCRTTTCSLDWKNNWKVAIFRLTLMSLLPRRPGWTDNLLNFFWVAYKS